MADWGSFSSAKQTAIARSELHAWHDNGSVRDMKQTLDDAYQSDTDPGCSVDFAADSIEALHLANYTHLEHTCDSAATGSETNIDGQVITPKAAPAPAPDPAPAPAAPAPAPAAAPAPAPVTDPNAATAPANPDTSATAQTLAKVFNTTENNAPGEKPPTPTNVSVINYAVSGQYAVANFYNDGSNETAFFNNGPNWTLLTYCGTNIRSTYPINGIPASTLSQLLAQTPVPSSAN